MREGKCKKHWGKCTQKNHKKGKSSFSGSTLFFYVSSGGFEIKKEGRVEEMRGGEGRVEVRGPHVYRENSWWKVRK